MEKRLSALLFLASLLSACSSSGASPEVKDFLTGLSGSKAYAATESVAVEETYRSLNGKDEELGKLASTYEMDRKDTYYWHRINLYTGDQVTNGVTKAEYLLLKKDDGYHTYTKTNDDVSTLQDISITEEKASSLIQGLIYTNVDSSYDDGGLYYGDIFKIQTNQFEQSAFSLNAEKTLLTFDYKYVAAYPRSDGSKDELYTTQKITINQTGLIVSSYELLRIGSTENAGENIVAPSYNPAVTRLTAI
jgi:hypothetical protein